MYPPNFDGKSYALATESQIKRIEKIFRDAFYTNEQKVKNATYILVDKVDECWTSA